MEYTTCLWNTGKGKAKIQIITSLVFPLHSKNALNEK